MFSDDRGNTLKLKKNLKEEICKNFSNPRKFGIGNIFSDDKGIPNTLKLKKKSRK